MINNEREKNLCRLIAGQSLSRKDAAGLTGYITGGMDWSSLAPAVFSEGLSSLLYYHCRNLDLLSHIPAETVKKLSRIYAEISIINRHRLRAMDALSGALEKKNLQVIVFKGGSLLNSVYNDPGLRPMEDIDLIVRHENMEDLKGVLETMGFVQNRSYPNSFSRGIISFDLHEDYLSAHRITARKDVLDIKADDVWRMSAHIRGSGFIRELSLHDSLIAMSLHLLKHRYRRLIGFVDIAETIRKYQLELSWTGLVEYSRTVRAERILLYAFLLMKHLVGFHVPGHVLTALGKERLCFVEKILLRLRLAHADPGALICILWVFQISGWTGKIRFVKESIFPRQEIMNQIYQSSSPRVRVLLRRAAAAFSQIFSETASAFRAARKAGLPPL